MSLSNNNLNTTLSNKPKTRLIHNAALHVDIEVDENGDTLLHRFLRDSKDADHLILSLNYLSKDKQIVAMTQVVNNRGETVFKIASDKEFSTKDKYFILKILREYHTTIPFTELKKEINANDVLKRIDKNNLNPALIDNIYLACDAVNKTRKLFKSSTTHPMINKKSSKEKNALCHELNDLRKKKYDKLEIEASKEKSFYSFYKLIKEFETNGLGNCEEFALATLYYGKFPEAGENIHLNVEAIYINNGDHVFVVFGRDPLSDINDETTWGNAAVIADSWKLDVFPAYKLKNRLVNHEYHNTENSSVDLTLHYNPNYNQLESYLDLPATQETIQNSHRKIKKNLTLPKIAKITGHTLLASPPILPTTITNNNPVKTSITLPSIRR